MNTFKNGDVVMHPRCPEWGQGVVRQTYAIDHDGRAAQRLVIDFANHGRVIINTAIAPLVAATEGSTIMPMPTKSFSSSFRSSSSSLATAHDDLPDRGWLAKLANNGQGHAELWRLPEAFSDPFISTPKRLAAILDSYRFGTDPRHARNLLDWATAQTKLNDPLSKYTRHELEQAFPRFVRDRDAYLTDMVRQLKKQGKAAIYQQALAETTLPQARAALERAIRA